jgi:translation initiation factor IF-1
MEREVEGIVRAQMPSGLYEVEIDGPQRVLAHAGGGMQRNFVRLLVGDRVAMVLMPRDPGRGRIVRRL